MRNLSQSTTVPGTRILPVWHQRLGTVLIMLPWGWGQMVGDCRGCEHSKGLVTLGEDLDPLAMVVLAEVRDFHVSCGGDGGWMIGGFSTSSVSGEEAKYQTRALWVLAVLTLGRWSLLDSYNLRGLGLKQLVHIEHLLYTRCWGLSGLCARVLDLRLTHHHET